MMAAQQIDIDYVAELARIELTDDERGLFSGQLAQILKYFDKLNAVNVEGVEAMAHAFPVKNVWAEDVPGSILNSDDVVRNTAVSKDHQVLLPKVVADS